MLENIYPVSFEGGETSVYKNWEAFPDAYRDKSSGIVEIEGIAKPFAIYFLYRPAGFDIYSIQADTGETEHQFGGKVEYSEGICILTYNAEDDKNNFWGEKTGQVTLTFLKEDLPEAG